jgi:hypothetical protein
MGISIIKSRQRESSQEVCENKPGLERELTFFKASNSHKICALIREQIEGEEGAS